MGLRKPLHGAGPFLLCVVFFATLAAPFSSSFAARAAERCALVIGNAAYPVAALKNPVNDARDMAAALSRLGFAVDLRTDLDRRGMEKAIRAFGERLKREGGVGLFYYAGHGVQVRGVNYLVPVRASLSSESDVKYECVDADRVLGKMRDAANALNVVILDACRNNPFARSFRSLDAGLARMNAPTGSIIAYSTAPDSVASDGGGPHGLYTKYLLRNIVTPGITIEEVFKRVRIGVMAETGGRQVPWESSSLAGYFYLAGGSPLAGAAAARDDRSFREALAELEAEKRQVEAQRAELARLRRKLAAAAEDSQAEPAPEEERLRNQLAELEAERIGLEAERQALAEERSRAGKKHGAAAPHAAMAHAAVPHAERAAIIARLSGVWRFAVPGRRLPELSLRPGGDTLYGGLAGDPTLVRRARLIGLAVIGEVLHVRLRIHPAASDAADGSTSASSKSQVFECSGDMTAGVADAFPVVCGRADHAEGAAARSGRMVRVAGGRK